jgi:hypothetical protein
VLDRVHAKYPDMVLLHGRGGVGVPKLYSAAAALLLEAGGVTGRRNATVPGAKK